MTRKLKSHGRDAGLAALVATLVGAFAAAPCQAQADAVAQFYEGKTIAFIVGAASGGGYDAQARLLAGHMGRFIPGAPNFVVQNMPGAGSLQAANFLYNIAPKDGSTIALLQRGILSTRFVNPEGARFDLGKFNWIGNMSSEAGVVLAWHTTPFHTFEDLKKQEFLVGGTGPMIDTETTPRILNALLGTRFKVITGYKGTADTALAMERGELHGMGDWSWSNVKTRRPDYFRDNKVRVLVQVTAEKLPDLPDTPSARDMVTNEEDRQVLDLFLAQKTAARPIAAPPGVPADRLKALRAAFEAATDDAQFKADAVRQKLEVEPMPGAQVEKVIDLFSRAPDALGKRLNAAIAPKE
ncbi:MAG: Bug family tripartite tricarboxylate transporter substrate binding protein [Beijerinckiaceae bacterium]|jgi:tripartite-type tricarboxylate transporter receptor subunit TctC